MIDELLALVDTLDELSAEELERGKVGGDRFMNYCYGAGNAFRVAKELLERITDRERARLADEEWNRMEAVDALARLPGWAMALVDEEWNRMEAVDA